MGLLAAVRGDTAGLLGINPAKPWLMVHCGTGGSANNLSAAQYAELLLGSQQQWPDCPCVVTAGPGEEVLGLRAGGGADPRWRGSCLCLRLA